MSAHTPGPWTQVNDCTVRGPHGEAVASTKGWADPPDVNHDANARLIAAAPELLEASCFALSRHLGSAAEQEVAAILRAAIAKAKGKPV